MNKSAVEYHSVCAAHGVVASVAVRSRSEPKAGRCPVCGRDLELWLGTASGTRSRAASHVAVKRRAN
jgi:hypothetical protein